MSGLRRPAVEWRAAATPNSACPASPSLRCSLRMEQPAASSAFPNNGRHPNRDTRSAMAVQPLLPVARPAWKKHCPVPCTRSRKPRGCAASAARIFWSERTAFTCWRSIPGPARRLDLFAQPGLFTAHLSGCRGEAIPTLPVLPGVRASAVAYARCPISLPTGFDWPGWAADRQPAGVRVPTHAPFCTVHADAPRTDAARALAGERIELILRLAEAAQ